MPSSVSRTPGIEIRREGVHRFIAERWPALPGSPTVGYASTPLEAVGALFWHAQADLGVHFSGNAIDNIRKWHPDHCWDTAR